MANYVHDRSKMSFETVIEIGFALGYCSFDKDDKLVFSIDLPAKDRKKLIKLSEQHNL